MGDMRRDVDGGGRAAISGGYFLAIEGRQIRRRAEWETRDGMRLAHHQNSSPTGRPWDILTAKQAFSCAESVYFRH